MRLYKTKKHISTKALISFIHKNPSLTAGGIAKILNYNWGTMSSRLYKLCKEAKLSRQLSHGMLSYKIKAWRYYPFLSEV